MADLEDSILDTKAEKRRAALVLDKTKGFMLYARRSEKYRSPKTRTKDWAELNKRLDEDELKYQSARCMDCGVPFCQSDTGCPISNIIPKVIIPPTSISPSWWCKLTRGFLVERVGFPKSMEERLAQAPADKSFPGIHWPCLPSPLRRRLCSWNQ
jgi:hypothetical protein